MNTLLYKIDFVDYDDFLPGLIDQLCVRLITYEYRYYGSVKLDSIRAM